LTKAGPTSATLAELDDLRPGIVGDIIEGVLYATTKPRMPHQRTRARLLAVCPRSTTRSQRRSSASPPNLRQESIEIRCL
jgi:hypothetical protein